MGIGESNDVVQGFETLHMEFSKLALDEVYVFQQAVATEIRIRENVVMYQETKYKRKEIAHKTLLREKEK